MSSAEGKKAASTTASGGFVREATGLVRDISPLQTFITTVGISNIGFGAAVFVFIPYVWPGANVALAFTLILPFLLVSSLVFYLMTIAMPRSGGDYVWDGRIVHPALAVGLFIPWIVVSCIFFGSYVNYTISYALYSVFLGAAISTGNSGLISASEAIFTNPVWIAVLGTLFLVYMGFILTVGVRRFLRAQLFFWLIGMAGTAAAMLLLAQATPTTFSSAFDSTLGGYITYERVISSAKSFGFAWAPALGATLGATAFAWLSNNGYQWSSYFSGEIRSVRKSMLFSTLGNNILVTAIFALFALLFVNAVGDNFLHSLAYLVYAHPSSYTIPVSPNPYFLASILTKSLPLALLVNVGFFVWGFVGLPAGSLAYTRVAMAISFDRVLPTSLADVSDRFHTPVKAITLIIAIEWLGMIASIYYGLVIANLNYTLMYTIILSIGGLVAALFPFIRKSLYRATPIAGMKVGGVPLITVVGTIVFLFFAFLAISVGGNPVVGGPTNPLALGILISSFFGSAAFYFVVRSYRRSRQGIDIGFAFREIPPE